ncbi:MAG: hypothetical protein QOC71_1566, partial [Thermoplasmata archaeon]|nr:hypothetical protein [Thermoplasmata archaeon]
MPGPTRAVTGGDAAQGVTPPIPLQVLIVEDDPEDVAKIVAELRAAGYQPDWRQVRTTHEFEANFNPNLDVVLSAYTLAKIDPLWILKKVRESRWHVPLVIVSGIIGDDNAAACLALGATDYVLKDRMARLGSAVHRAIEERTAKVANREAAAALHRSEERMRGILATLQDVVWSLSLVDWKVLFMSPAGEQMFGRPVAEFYENGQLWLDSVHPEDRDRVAAAQREMIRWGTGDVKFRVLRADGSIRHVHTRAWCAYLDGKPFRLEGINTDITERIDAAELLEHQHAALEEAQAIAHLGSWEWDPAKDVVTFSKEGWRIWGQGLTASISSAALMENVHPEDRPGFEATVAAAVASGLDYDVTVRIETHGERHTRHRGHVSLRSLDGQPIRMNG